MQTGFQYTAAMGRDAHSFLQLTTVSLIIDIENKMTVTNEDYLHCASVEEAIVSEATAIDSPVFLQIIFILDESTVHNILVSNANVQCQFKKWFVQGRV